MHASRSPSGHPVHRVAFSPCGGWFATAQPHHGITLLDRSTGAAVRTFGSARRTGYASLAFLRGGAWVAAAGSKGLEVYATATGERVHVCTWFHGGPAAGVHGDTILSGGPLSVVEILVPPGPDRTGREYLTVPDVSYYALAVSGPWAVGFREAANPVAIDLAVRRAGLSLAHPVRLDTVDAMTQRNVPGAAFAPAAPRVALLDGKTVTVFDLSADDVEPVSAGVPPPRPVGAPLFTLPPPDEWKAGEPWRPPVAFAPDGRHLLVKRPRERVQLWDANGGTLAAEWSWRLEGITCLAVAPDGLTAVAGGRFGRVLTWDLE